MKLKPCPMCGSPAKLFVDRSGVRAECTRPDCAIKTTAFDDTANYEWNKPYGTTAIELAVERWNRRVGD